MCILLYYFSYNGKEHKFADNLLKAMVNTLRACDRPGAYASKIVYVQQLT